MNVDDSLDSISLATKRIAPDPLPVARLGRFMPTTIFLKTEREMDASVQRGRKSSRGSATDVAKEVPERERQFGVQSLEETLSTLPTEGSASRAASISTDRSSEPNPGAFDVNTPAKRKRRAGNRVHPSIRSAGERIISNERVPTQTSFTPPILPESPVRSPHVRRNSAASPINMTPIRMSPPQSSATPSTPRSGSPRSLQLSDLESVAEDTSSQAVQSSSGDDDLERTPQLVFPSLTMPTRRAFTERGKHIGRAKFMVIGHQRGIGSTSLVNSILRSCEHVVHVDHIADQPSFNTDGSDTLSTSAGTDKLDRHNPSEPPATRRFIEVLASTRTLPNWRSWASQSESKSGRKPSIIEGALARNLTFIDAPSLIDDETVQAVLEYVTASLLRTANTDYMSESEHASMLSGDGGSHITAILYLFNPEASASPLSGISPAHQGLLRSLSKFTNFIPLIGKADRVSAEELRLRKEQILQLLELVDATPCELMRSDGGIETQQPLGISSLPGDDNDTIDASILMSSQYLTPLVPSELSQLLDDILEPEPVTRLRYESSWKFLAWRRGNLAYHLGQAHLPRSLSPLPGYQTTDLASDGSFPEDSSKALVQPSASSLGHSESSAAPKHAASSAVVTGTSALARYNELAQPSEPFRQVRLAKWAKDLQNSLQNQSRRYQRFYQAPLSDWAVDEDDKHQALVTMKGGRQPARGHLGGEVGVIDPRDPLGMLAFAQAFRRRGLLVVQLVGGCGIIGAICYCAAKNWPDVLEFFGLSTSTDMVHTTAVPPPARRDHGPLMRWLAEFRLI